MDEHELTAAVQLWAEKTAELGELLTELVGVLQQLVRALDTSERTTRSRDPERDPEVNRARR